ncbi:MAG TPA: hypothetical protein VM029_23640 [Opitutaceae bacterium]|nr:hypothetical protein [Opitutaceae bacterium]
MHLISRRTHGVLDYVVGAVLILSPRIFGFDPEAAESHVPVLLGVAAVVYSVFTRYELGVVRLLPFRAHLALDLLNGMLLTASPWLFGFADRVWAPHAVLGLVELGAVCMTRAGVHTDHVGTPAHT